MKKWTCLILVAVMLTVGFVGVAESIDLSSYSDDAIAALYEQVELEIINRGIGKTAVFAKGTYKVGEGQHIPAGSYVIKSAVIGNESGTISVRTPDDPPDEDEIPSKLYASARPEYPYFGYVMLEEGDVLTSRVTFTLTISAPAAVFK